MSRPRHVVVPVTDQQIVELQVLGWGEEPEAGEFEDVLMEVKIPVPPDDQLRQDVDIAYDALYDAAGDRRAKDHQFDISRQEAAENERVADQYVAAAARLRARFNLDQGDD